MGAIISICFALSNRFTFFVLITLRDRQIELVTRRLNARLGVTYLGRIVARAPDVHPHRKIDQKLLLWYPLSK